MNDIPRQPEEFPELSCLEQSNPAGASDLADISTEAASEKAWQPDDEYPLDPPPDAPEAVDAEQFDSADGGSESAEPDQEIDLFAPIQDAPEEVPTAPVPEPEVREEKTKPKRSKRFIILSVLLLLLTVGAVGVIGYVYLVINPYESYDKIMPNVYRAGVNLGGMTPQEAQAAIETAMRYPSYEVKVVLPDAEYVFHPHQEGVTLNGEALARQAYAYGRNDESAYGMYQAYHDCKKTELHLDALVTLEYSTQDIQDLAVAIYRETEILPTESSAGIDAENHIVTGQLGQPGRRIEPQVIYDAVCDAFSTMEFEDIHLDYDKVEIDLEQAKSVCMDAAKRAKVRPVDPVIEADEEQHTIELTIGTQGWVMNGEKLFQQAQQSVEQEQYDAVSLEMDPVEPGEIDITDAYYVLACSPSEPYYYAGTVYEGTYGYTLDWEKAIGDIMASTYGDHLSIAMTPIPPQKTAEQIRAVLFRDRLASYSTAHTANSNRTHNLTLACQAINGTVLNAGETFSFNNVVGERTSAKGYRSATVYVGTKSVEELGGGICQVASTIYNAALLSEMTITERTWHQFFVTYVPGGLDATVYWGSVDLKFTNNTDYPIRINASVSGGYVNITIDGTKTNDHVVKLSSTCLSTVPYGTQYEYSSAYPAGYSSQTVSPYTGYTYEAYQSIYDGNGNLIECNYLGQSTYSKRDEVITIGTG